MGRKHKADKEAEQAAFRRQSFTFKKPHVRLANFHTVTASGTTVSSSILGRTNSYSGPQPKILPPDPQLAPEEHDDESIDEVPSPEKKQTRASATDEKVIHVLMLADVYRTAGCSTISSHISTNCWASCSSWKLTPSLDLSAHAASTSGPRDVTIVCSMRRPVAAALCSSTDCFHATGRRCGMQSRDFSFVKIFLSSGTSYNLATTETSATILSTSFHLR
jgi:hypothetical protein